ncbi:MAG: phenylalanine--tRNA ligase subunit beta [Patescibacteria group bacterium]
MNISLNCLKEYVNLSGIKIDEIKDKLTAHTVEVEQIIRQGDNFKNVIVAKVLSTAKHPQADKLKLVLVDAGERGQLKIVCGAPNVESGQMVPLALVGAILPNGLEIKKAEIRGEESNGMICAEDELGLGEDHDGIMVLDKKAKIGQNFADYLGLNDIVLEIDNKSISNRPDLWGHYGIARELSVLFDLKLKKYEPKVLKIKEDIKKDNISVSVKDKKLCLKYIALKIENIKIEKSPKWLSDRLLSVGMKSINNIVDATNYTMLETGQPLHAFDADYLDEIIVRTANKNEKIVTLDDVERSLNENDLIIANSKEAVAIAGVMGGKNSEINNTTSSIVLEVANFNDVSVRKTAQRLSARTDAAMRFEKGLDPSLCDLALRRFVEIVKDLCPKAVFNFQPVVVENYKQEERFIALNLNWAERIIGQKIEKKEVKKILEKLNFEVEEKDDNNLNIGIPSWRLKDINIKEDLIEEIIRIFGYNNIDIVLPKTEILPPEKSISMETERRVISILSCSYNFSEVYNYSFVNEEQLTKLGIDPSPYIKLLNPLSKQHTLLRQTLSTNLFSNIKLNQSKYPNLSVFEVGNIFLNIPGELPKDFDSRDNLPHQDRKLALTICREDGNTFSELKDIIYNFILELTNGLEIDFVPTESIISWADKNEKCLLVLGSKEIGFLAKLDPSIATKNGIKKETASLEINFSMLVDIIVRRGPTEYKPIAKFPSINRDLAFVLDKKILFSDISKEIRSFNPLITSLELFDVYMGDKIDENKKSMAFHLIYQSTEKTLTSEEVDSIQAGLIKKMGELFDAKIRDF